MVGSGAGGGTDCVTCAALFVSSRATAACEDDGAGALPKKPTEGGEVGVPKNGPDDGGSKGALSN